MEMLKNFLKKILGIDKLEYKIRLLERKNYWREKYHGSKSINDKIRKGKKLGFSERARAVSKGLLPSKAKKEKNEKTKR
jgi:hypothetical protein